MKKKVRQVKGRRGRTWKGVRLAVGKCPERAQSAQRGTGSSKRAAATSGQQSVEQETGRGQRVCQCRALHGC